MELGVSLLSQYSCYGPHFAASLSRISLKNPFNDALDQLLRVFGLIFKTTLKKKSLEELRLNYSLELLYRIHI